MPLTLRPPRQGRTPNYEIRGTYLGVPVECSSGTHKRSIALQQIKRIEAIIEEHGQYPAPEPKPHTGEPTFLSAAIAYMRDGGERCYMKPLLQYFGETLIRDIDQAVIDEAAKTLLPHGAPDYRNRRIYTPVSAVLHHALGDDCPRIRRPKGSKGRERKDFMWPKDAFAIIAEAEKIDSEFGLYLYTLLYTGIRKSEGRAILAEDVRPDDLGAWLRDSKNGDPRMLKLRQDLADRLRAHLEANPGRDRLFKFKEGGHFKHLLLRATMAVCGLECPKRRPTGWKKPDAAEFRLAFVGFHTFRHTWATWMRMYGGADLQGLAGTKNWKDVRSVARYSHVVPRDEWDRVDNLPTPGNTRGKISNAGN
jgi:integrase